MKLGNKWFVRLIDLLGAAVVAACVSGGVWMSFVHGDRTKEEIRNLTRSVTDARRNITAIRTERERQEELLVSHKAALARNGELPTQTPVEEYFQTLARLATRHRLCVVRHNPLSVRSYPGLLEQRHAYEVRGATSDLVGFLKAIERTEFWADVSYLRIIDGQTGKNDPDTGRAAMLTISVFSAIPNQSPSKNG